MLKFMINQDKILRFLSMFDQPNIYQLSQMLEAGLCTFVF